MEIWLCADCNFGQNMKRDQEIIKNWNEIVADEDSVIILGDFFVDNMVENTATEIIRQLKGKKCIYNFYDNNTKLTQEFYESLGIKVYKLIGLCWSNDDIHLITIKNLLYKAKLHKNVKYVAARSILEQKEIYKNGVMSISMSDWGNAPLKCNSIPTLFENLVEFDKLEV